MPVSSVAKRDLSLPAPLNQVTVGAANYAVSQPTPIPPESRNSLSIYFTVSSLVLGVGETARVRLQQLTGSDTSIEADWSQVGNDSSPLYVNITANGLYGYLLSSTIPVENTVLPISTPIRLVATTGPGTSMTISDVLLVGSL